MDGVPALLEASEEGDLAGVQNLLEAGLDVNSADSEDLTALQVAAGNGHEHIVRLLLMKGATLDMANSYGWTPLLNAARNGHPSVVSLLLQHKADINARNKLGASAMVLAARGGHLQTVKLLLQAGIDLTPTTGICGSTCEFTPLQAAAHHGHDAVVRFLLDRGYDVNYRTPSTGVNTLMLAALNGHMTTSQILVETGANPNNTNVNEHTPLDIASISGKREVKGYLDRKTSNKRRMAAEDVKPDIIEAAKRGDLSRMLEVMEEDLSQRDACSPQDGATPLMFAAMTGRLDIAQALVEKGCDINKQDTVSGWTALMQATYHGKKIVAKYLINAGADVLIPAKNGCTAFDMASLIEDVDTELYRLLANKAVQINNKSERGTGGGGDALTATARKSRTWSPKQQNNGTVGTGGQQGEEQPKTGLKAWWSRMSNRFRNLKLGRTFNLNTNRLAPLPVDGNAPNSATLKGSSSPKQQPHQSQQQQSQSQPATPQLPPQSAPPTPPLNPLPSMLTQPDTPPPPAHTHHPMMHDPLGTTSASAVSTLSAYETLMLDTKKTASLYTLGFTTPHSSIQDSTLKPVLPPFLPPPTFETDRPKMPPTTTRKSISAMGSTSTLTSTRPILPPMKLLQSYSTQNIASASASPSASTKFLHSTNASPSSSAGASGLNSSTGTSGGKSRGPSSASSSTLTAGSDNLNRSGPDNVNLRSDLLFTPVSRVNRSSAFMPPGSTSTVNENRVSFPRSHTSPSSSMSGSSSVTPRRHSRGKSGSSSRDSASTLTPSPSPTPKPPESTPSSSSKSSLSNAKHSLPAPPPEGDELGGILKNLSLELYQPIFEEQEVDMEAFLTLTDLDLRELGISHGEPRRQILAAITELNSGKGRERQHLHETMSQYSDTLPRTSYRPDSGEVMGFTEWNLHEEEAQQAETIAKSRAA